MIEICWKKIRCGIDRNICGRISKKRGMNGTLIHCYVLHVHVETERDVKQDEDTESC